MSSQEPPKVPKQGMGGGVNVGHSLSPPSHFMLATGLSCWGHLKPLQILLTYIKTKVYEDLEYFYLFIISCDFSCQ